MTTLTEGKNAGSFIMNEDPGHRSREAIVIASGEGVVAPGTVLGKIGNDTGAVTVSPPAGYAGNAGGVGAMTLATPAYGAGVKEGTYRVTCIEPASGAGTFEVVGPDGVAVGIATVGVAFDGVIKFTIADGTPDFVAGEGFTVAVAIANAATAGKYKVAKPAGTDGSQNGAAINIYGVDATSADVTVAGIVRHAEVNGNELTYDATVDDAPKKAAIIAGLTAASIIVR